MYGQFYSLKALNCSFGLSWTWPKQINPFLILPTSLVVIDSNQPSCQTQLCCLAAKTRVGVGRRCSCHNQRATLTVLQYLQIMSIETGGKVSVASSRPAHTLWAQLARHYNCLPEEARLWPLCPAVLSKHHPSFCETASGQFKLKIRPDALGRFIVQLAFLHTSPSKGSICLPHHKNVTAFIKSKHWS